MLRGKGGRRKRRRHVPVHVKFVKSVSAMNDEIHALCAKTGVSGEARLSLISVPSAQTRCLVRYVKVRRV